MNLVFILIFITFDRYCLIQYFFYQTKENREVVLRSRKFPTIASEKKKMVSLFFVVIIIIIVIICLLINLCKCKQFILFLKKLRLCASVTCCRLSTGC